VASGSPSTTIPPAIATTSIAAIITVTTGSGRPRWSARWKLRNPAAVTGTPIATATAPTASVGAVPASVGASAAIATLVIP
jgi:hypothetical protein